MHTTSRLGLDVVDSSDAVSGYPTVDAQAKGVLDNAVTYSQGTLASLPAASLAGRRYYATDIAQELYDTGSSWIPVASATPIGAMTQYAGSADPVDADGTTRWNICDGRAISRTTYARLFTAVSTTYGSGNGTTTFNIPDMRGRVPQGVSGSYALASTGGEATHTLLEAEIPDHNHVYGGYVAVGTNVFDGSAGLAPGAGPACVETPVGGFTNLTNTGSINGSNSGAHNNLQPYLAVNHIIKVL